MLVKFEFYQRYGVEEYYVYDPEDVLLTGWQRSDDQLMEIPQMDGWISPRLDIRFDLSGAELQIFGADGRPFASYLEVIAQRDQEEREKKQAQQQAAQAQQQAAQAQQQAASPAAAQAQQQAAQAQQQAAQAAGRAERLAAQLRALGIEPE